MKKNLLIILMLSISTAASAQWYVGFKMGSTISNYKAKTPWKEVSNFGINAGATAYKQINPKYGLHFELQYIQKGYNHKICNDISDKLKANYIEIPIMIDYSLFFVKNWKAHANLGFYAAYWMSGKYVTKGFDGTGESFDFSKNKASRFDIGPNAGGRLEYILKNGSLFLDFRYEIGLLDMQKKINDNTKNTNRALVIGVSYLKRLGK